LQAQRNDLNTNLNNIKYDNMIMQLQDKLLNWYDKAWGLIDIFDKKHAEQNTQWQQREIDQVIRLVESFHSKYKGDYGSEQLHIERINKVLDKHYKEGLDFLDMDTLKDSIHKILEAHGGDEDKDFVKNIYEGKPIEYFTRESFIQTTYFGHGKEAFEKSEDRRAYFFYEVLEKVNKDIAESFFTMLHDLVQQKLNAGIVEQIEDFINYKNMGLIDANACDKYLLMIQEAVEKETSSGKSTWNVHKINEKIHNAYRYIDGIYDYKTKKRVWNNGYDLTEAEIYNSINCAEMNCNIRVLLSEDDRKRILNGYGLKDRYCEHHTKVDDGGKDRNNEKLEWYIKNLPKTPVVLRWMHVDNDSWLGKKNLRDRVEGFIKANKESVSILKEGIGTFIDGHMDEDRKITPRKREYLYLQIENKPTLIRFIDSFGDDFSSTCSTPEILRDRKQINEYKQWENV